MLSYSTLIPSPLNAVVAQCRDVKVSRPAWFRGQFFGLGLGLTVIGLALGLGLMR